MKRLAAYCIAAVAMWIIYNGVQRTNHMAEARAAAQAERERAYTQPIFNLKRAQRMENGR